MTRLALAKTLVSGTVTLQGMTYSFTASASGTATADRVPQAKKAATEASNAAAVIAARASIDAILLNNSAVLSDLEITSLISNNLSTTVVVYKPIGIETIATSTDGINYFLSKDTTIEADEWLQITNGITFKAVNYKFANKGFIQVGGGQSSSTQKYGISGTYEVSICQQNSGRCQVNSGGVVTIDADGTLYNTTGGQVTIDAGGQITNNGNLTNYDNGVNIENYGTIINNLYITNYGTETDIYNYSGGTITNNITGVITNDALNTYIYNFGTLDNSGCVSNYKNEGTITGIPITGTQPTTSSCLPSGWTPCVASS